jgi:iron transport multicopper oxidase
VNNGDAGRHPCDPLTMLADRKVHLHGHQFQVLYRSEEDSGPYNESMDLVFPENPMRRDTVQLMPNGFAMLRFRADNPGIWLVYLFLAASLLVVSLSHR